MLRALAHPSADTAVRCAVEVDAMGRHLGQRRLRAPPMRWSARKGTPVEPVDVVANW